MTIGQLLAMAATGTSVTLSWDDDSREWECSWIASGKRFTAHDADPRAAVGRVWVVAHAPTPVPT